MNYLFNGAHASSKLLVDVVNNTFFTTSLLAIPSHSQLAQQPCLSR